MAHPLGVHCFPEIYFMCSIFHSGQAGTRGTMQGVVHKSSRCYPFLRQNDGCSYTGVLPRSPERQVRRLASELSLEEVHYRRSLRLPTILNALQNTILIPNSLHFRMELSEMLRVSPVPLPHERVSRGDDSGSMPPHRRRCSGLNA